MTIIKKIFLLTSALQCIVILFMYTVLANYKIDGLFIFVFFYSFFLGLFMLKNQFKILLANNSVLIFFIFLFLYGIFNPTIEFLMLTEITSRTYFAAIIYAACLPSFLLGTIIFKKIDYASLYLNSKSKFKKSYAIFVIPVLFSLIAYKVVTLYEAGLLFNPSALKGVDRAKYFDTINQVDVVVGLLITSIFIYFIYNFSHLSKKMRKLVIGILVFYVAIQLSAGNRRDFIPMLIGFFWIFANYKKLRFTFIRFLGILIVIALFLFLGTVRSSIIRNESLNSSQALLETLTSNEFTYPFFTLSFEIEKNLNNEQKLLYGKTIFIDSFLIFIPRDFYPEKPLSLGTMFKKDNFGDDGIGFAYTPVTEFYKNFGGLGPAFIYFVIGMLIVRLQNRSDQRLNFILFTMLIDFSRGEIATFFYQFVFVSLFLLIIPNFSKILHLK